VTKVSNIQVKSMANIEYLKLVVETEIRKLRSIFIYIIRSKSIRAPYEELWYHDVCKYFRITPKQALLIAAGKNRPTIEIWRHWDANKNVVEQSEQDVIQMWKRMAKDFIIRNCYCRESFWIDWNRKLQLLNYKAGEKILDYGCGAGSFAKWALGKSNTIDITLAELEGIMMEFLKWRFGEKVQYIPIRGGKVDLGGRFDIILCLDVLEHVWSPLELAKEFVRSLNQGGRLMETYINDKRGSNLIKANLERQEVICYLNENMGLVQGNLKSAGPRVWVKGWER